MIAIKNQAQIDGIRRSCKLAAATVAHVGTLVSAGVTTEQLNQAAAKFMADHGAVSATLNYQSASIPVPFPKETCISVNEIVCHGIASDSVILKEGDIVKVDVTTILDGFYGDTCKTFAVGKVNRKVQDLMYTGEHCLNLGISQIKPGGHLNDIGHAIEKYAKAFGYSVVRQFCGHGTGLAFHEEPKVQHEGKKGTGPVLKPGMIFTVEPMLNQGKWEVVIDEADHWTARTIDKKLSVQYEHTVLVTETGFEILTAI